MSIFESIKLWAKKVKRDAVMLWFAYRHPDTPFFVKALCFFTVAYALSPIDLIPDFIPILGYLDDAILLPALIWLGVRLLPNEVITACRIQADQWIANQGAKPRSYAGAAFIVVVWFGVVGLSGYWFFAR